MEIEGDTNVVCIFLVALVALLDPRGWHLNLGDDTVWNTDGAYLEVNMGTKVTVFLLVQGNCATRVRLGVESKVKMSLSGSTVDKGW